MSLDRRAFVQFAVGGVAGVLLSPAPWWLARDAAFWSQNWPWIPKVPKGEIAFKNGISKLCPNGCAVAVRTVEGAPTLVQGVKDHPLSMGGVCPACAAGAQLLYSPARVKGPMKRTASGSYEPVTWEEAMTTLASKLSAVKGKEGKVAMVSGDLTGTANEVFSAFVAALGSQDFTLMPSEGQVAAKAWAMMGGAGQVGYDLKNADFVLMIGADAFESFGPMVRNKKTFAAQRPAGQAAKASYVYAGPVRNRTAAVCDQFVGVPSDGLAAFALGLAAALVQGGKAVDAADFADFKAMVTSAFSPDKVEKMTGVKAAVLADLAKKLAAAKAPVVMAGSPFGQGEGVAPFMAGAALNLLLGRLNQAGGMKVFADFAPVVKGAFDRKKLMEQSAADYFAKMEKGKAAPEVLLVYEANPAYGLPQAEAMGKALEKIPFVVSFASFMDETAQKAQLVLPAPLPMERMDDLSSPYGFASAAYGVGLPATKPVADVKGTPDLILGLAKKMGLDLGFEKFEAVLKAKAEAVGATWADLTKGKLYTSDATKEVSSLTMATATLAKAAVPAAKDGNFPLSLAPLAQLNVGTSALATAPQALVTIRDTELLGNDMFVQVCSETAKTNGLTQGAKVKLSSAKGECVARVNINETVMPGVVAVPLGFGRTAWDKFTRGKGDNLNKVLALAVEPGSSLNVWADTRVKVAKI